MLYFNKSDLAETYNISVKTVTNWIRDAKDGKLGLELHQEGSKAWIANTTSNVTLIKQLVEERRKFRNTRTVKTIRPKPEFYQLYNQAQVFDIALNLDTHREIPFQYGYFDGGADFWDKYAQRLASENISNHLRAAIELIDINQAYLDALTARYDTINVIDVGVGNAMPARKLLERLKSNSKLGTYVGIDTSPSMLRIAEHNIDRWFDGTVRFVGIEADINYERFAYQVAQATKQGGQNAINIVLVLGGTLTNLRSIDGALRVIHDSMSRSDVLVYSAKLDNEATRQYFDFGIGPNMPPLDVKAKMVLDLLDINESFYDVEMGYDTTHRERYMRIRLKVQLTIHFEIDGATQDVELQKNDTILLWRAWHQTAEECMQRFDRENFEVLQASQTENQNYLLTIARLKSSSNC